MEEGQKRQKSLRSRFRECFKPGVPQSLVPLDIWKHILLNTDPQSLGGMAQTSKAFEEVVREDIRVNNYPLARQYRKEGQIGLALTCLKSCVDHNHPEATFQLGYSHMFGGWGVETRYYEKGSKYCKKAFQLGYDCGVLYGHITSEIREISPEQLTNPLSRGFYYEHVMGEIEIAIKYYEKSAQEGNELAQWTLANHYRNVSGTHTDHNKAMELYLKSAEQGFGQAQQSLGQIMLNSMERERWSKKALAQNTNFYKTRHY